MAVKKKAKTLDALLFIDTNIFLDFYRARGRDAGLSVLSHLAAHQDRLVLTSQVEMEFMKNRQDAILEAHRQFKAPDWGSGTVPSFLVESKPNKGLETAKKQIQTQMTRMRTRIARVLTEPAKYDEVYKALKPLFRATTPYCLGRKHDARDTIRRLALKRFGLGYPPRKDSDTSIGDAINWEWMVRCAQKSGKHLILVSRDTDYGSVFNDSPVLNDWLRHEFSERVSNKRKLVLTGRLTEAFKLLAIPVTEKEVAQETALIEQSSAAKRPVALPPMIAKVLTQDEATVVTLMAGLIDNKEYTPDEVAGALGKSVTEVMGILRTASGKINSAVATSKKGAT